MIIYFINLDERIDRKQFFENQFKDSNLNPIRISAISLKEDDNNLAPPAVSACWLSHQLAYKKLLATTDSHALIFEDDANINSELIEIVQKIDEVDLSNIDLFQLGYLKDSNGITVDSGKIDILHRWSAYLVNYANHKVSKKILNFKNRFLRSKFSATEQSELEKIRISLGISPPILVDSFEAGAHCYVISRKLARELVDYNKNPVIISADLLLIEVANSKKFKCLRVSKSLCFQDSSLGSNILLRSKKNLSQFMSGLN